MVRNICEIELPALFPAEFFWGAATAAHQIQGSPNSNWGQWERSKARIEDLKSRGLNVSVYISGNGCEMESRYYKKDLELARALSHNAHRFGINWATVEPERGVFDTNILKRYANIMTYARECGIEPFVTLYWWTHPAWFERMGSWKHQDSPALFARFVAEVMKYIGDIVDYYPLLNEINVYAGMSFRWGEFPPHEHDERVWTTVIQNLLEAHRRAYPVIKSRNSRARVGISHAANWQEAVDPAALADIYAWNFEPIDQLLPYLDWIGLNTYMHIADKSSLVPILSGADPCTTEPVISDSGWGMCPRAMGEILKEFSKKYTLPLIITEHGHSVAEIDDRRRCWYLWESLKWIHQAMQKGADLRGYLHWSLMDNFEWAEGYAKKFGLLHIDRTTMRRTPRTSAYLLRDIIAAGGLTQEIADTYRSAIRHPLAV